MKAVVVDTNILFSILLRKKSRLRDVFLSAKDVRFYCCRLSIAEIFKHKSKILRYSSLSEEELFDSFHRSCGGTHLRALRVVAYLGRRAPEKVGYTAERTDQW